MKTIDHEQITMLIEGAGIEAVRPILEAYWESNDELKASIAAAIESGSPSDIAATAHGLKGSSANLGAVLVASRALEIELAAKAGDISAAQDAYAKLDEDIDATREAFNEILSEAA
ncbi:MAG: Hpt domain-containing protein [Pseudomonadota bacterium]